MLQHKNICLASRYLVVSQQLYLILSASQVVVMATVAKPAVEEVKKKDAPEEAKTPPAELNEDEEDEGKDTPTKGKGKRKAKTTPKKEPTPKKEKTTPKKEKKGKETTPNKKEKKDAGSEAHKMETRTKRKAREAVDLVVGGPQRAEVFFSPLFLPFISSLFLPITNTYPPHLKYTLVN